MRDWLNEHPFKNEPDARLICNLNNGSSITPDNIDEVMKQLRRRITRLLENGEGKLDKEATSYDDVFDAFRLAMKYYKYN